MKKIFIILYFLLFVFATANCQFEEPKFGKFDPSELSMTRYEKDTTAEALILFDNGTSRFFVDGTRFKFEYNRHYRLKVFSKSAASSEGNFFFPLYHYGSSEESLTSLKAATFNVVNGKLIKTKVSSDNIFSEDYSKNIHTKKIAFPEVREGSIIEIEYSITSNLLYNFRDWQFQYAYPALWSQYFAEIPEYYTYRQTGKGYLPFFINKFETGHHKYNVYIESQIDGGLGGGRAPAEHFDIDAETNTYLWATKDVPAFIEEPDIDSKDNYIQSIDFELASVQMPQSIRQDYVKSWESVNKEMIDDEDFGKTLNSNGFIEDTVASLCKGLTSSNEKAIAIFNYVQNRMKWNGHYSEWASRGLKKPFKERSGNSAEINLLLTLMLKTAGLNADPVLLSTRKNGIALSVFPTIVKYNSVIVRFLGSDSKPVLLDASDEYCSFGLLPFNDINGKGRVVNQQGGDWVDLVSQSNYKESKTYQLSIQPDGNMSGTIIETYDGYAGIAQRKEIDKEKNVDEYIKKLQENTKGLTVKEFKINNKGNIYKPITDSLVVEISDRAEILGDKIIFSPLLFETIIKNKYTLEDRKYPVNYAYPINEYYSFVYTIPDGYQVESLPQPGIFKLPDNSASFLYNVTSLGNKINVVCKRNINKVLYLPDEYKPLKEFYDIVVKKHSEQIILKKIV